MGVLDILRNGIALADSLTADLQDTVTHEAWTGQDFNGKPTYAVGITRAAIVERKQRLIKGIDGREVMSTHYVGFIRPISPNGAAGRQEPVDPRDRITLSNGSTGPIVSLDGFMDRAFDRPMYTQIYLG